MIDWHNHVLPNMDDGSHSVAESIAMLRAQVSQGVTTVIATPHFYANDESVTSFLERRSRSMETLREQCADDGLPSLRLGAEVRYYPGISRMEGISSLCIEGSNLLLLEMPMSRWTKSMVRELIEMSGRGGICLVLAHIDRYFSLQSREVWSSLLDNGILMQTNASFFSAFTTRRKALSLLKEGYVHLLGSDCHNMTSRPPQMERALDIIQKRLGVDYLCQMNEYGYSLLDIHSNLA
jgi:protein-tyrosine phosphatase